MTWLRLLGINAMRRAPVEETPASLRNAAAAAGERHEGANKPRVESNSVRRDND